MAGRASWSPARRAAAMWLAVVLGAIAGGLISLHVSATLAIAIVAAAVLGVATLVAADRVEPATTPDPPRTAPR